MKYVTIIYNNSIKTKTILFFSFIFFFCFFILLSLVQKLKSGKFNNVSNLVEIKTQNVLYTAKQSRRIIDYRGHYFWIINGPWTNKYATRARCQCSRCIVFGLYIVYGIFASVRFGTKSKWNGKESKEKEKTMNNHSHNILLSLRNGIIIKHLWLWFFSFSFFFFVVSFSSCVVYNDESWGMTTANNNDDDYKTNAAYSFVPHNRWFDDIF